MGQLLLGLGLFFGIHSVSIIAAPLRDRLAAQSALGWRAVYSVIALVGLVLMVRGYADLRLAPTVLYVTPSWMRHLAALLLLPTFILFFAPYLPGRIKSVTKHPQLTAIKLWALAHLLVNGTLADVLLFGAFLAWAVADRISLSKRVARPLSTAPASQWNDIILISVGLALYAITVFWLHEKLIGVPPFLLR